MSTLSSLRNDLRDAVECSESAEKQIADAIAGVERLCIAGGLSHLTTVKGGWQEECELIWDRENESLLVSMGADPIPLSDFEPQEIRNALASIDDLLEHLGRDFRPLQFSRPSGHCDK